MPVFKVMKKAKKLSYARLSPLAKGRMVGLREAGMERSEIAKRVKKKDGSIQHNVLFNAMYSLGISVCPPVRF